MCTSQRLTLIACNDERERDWNHYSEMAARLVFLGGGTLLRYEILAALCEPTLDVERLILDGTVTAEQFLDVLANLEVVGAAFGAVFESDVHLRRSPACRVR